MVVHADDGMVIGKGLTTVNIGIWLDSTQKNGLARIQTDLIKKGTEYPNISRKLFVQL